MQKFSYAVCVVVISVLLLVLLLLGLNDILCKKPTQTVLGVDFLRTSTLTVCAFAIGYVTILFQISPKDKYGHSIKQDSHFEIFYLKAAIKSPFDKRRKRNIPLWVLLPYPIYFICIISSSIFYISNLLVAMFLLCVLAIAYMCFYVLHMLRITYSQDWLFNQVQYICIKSGEKLSQLTPEETDRYVHIILGYTKHALRIVAENGYSTSTDILNAHNSSAWLRSSIRYLTASNDNFDGLNSTGLNAFIDYYANLIVFYCMISIEHNDYINVPNLVNELFRSISGQWQVKDYPAFVVAIIAACKILRSEFIQENDLQSIEKQRWNNENTLKSIKKLLHWLQANLDDINTSTNYSIVEELYRAFIKSDRDFCSISYQQHDLENKEMTRILKIATSYFEQ